jgi:CBS domain-containing membrane protein
LISFAAILILGIVSIRNAVTSESAGLLMSSFGATAALIFGAPQADASQPRAVLFGHTIGALCGLVIRALLVELPDSNAGAFVATALAVSSSIFIMMLFRLLHPPGAATALSAAGGAGGTLGFFFIISPTLVGACILILLAVLLNNCSRSPARKYPRYW